MNYYDTVADLWKSYVSSSLDGDPITNLDATNGQVAIQSTGTTYIPYTEFQLQVVYTSTHTKITDPTRSVTDEFTLIVKASCNGNTLTLLSSLPDVEYFVGEGDLNR